MTPIAEDALDPISGSAVDGDSTPVVMAEDVPATELGMPALIIPIDVVADDPVSDAIAAIDPEDVAAEREPSVSRLAEEIVPLDADAEYPARTIPDACDAAMEPTVSAADIPESCDDVVCVVAPGVVAVDRPDNPMDLMPMSDPPPAAVVAESPVSASMIISVIAPHALAADDPTIDGALPEAIVPIEPVAETLPMATVGTYAIRPEAVVFDSPNNPTVTDSLGVINPAVDVADMPATAVDIPPTAVPADDKADCPDIAKFSAEVAAPRAAATDDPTTVIELADAIAPGVEVADTPASAEVLTTSPEDDEAATPDSALEMPGDIAPPAEVALSPTSASELDGDIWPVEVRPGDASADPRSIPKRPPLPVDAPLSSGSAFDAVTVPRAVAAVEAVSPALTVVA